MWSIYPVHPTIFRILALGAALLSGGAIAQQPDATKFNQNYENAVAKARQECTALWSDRVFDPLRNRLPLGDVKPTHSMLTNSERIRPREKPLADLAIKTNEKCRAAYSPAFALLLPQINSMIDGVYRNQDALIAELYVGKITFGQYNIQMDRLTGDLSRSLSGVPQSPQAAPIKSAEPVKTPAETPAKITRPSREEHGTKPLIAAKDTRIALVIGNGGYSNLPRLSNPANDARSIADVLSKIGFTTRLVLDVSEQALRREVRSFASQSSNADVALVFYAGHGAQVNGENYVLPVDIDVPQTESDIQLTGLKVDDLVNSIRSSTKIVFLDACRDNPALFSNMVKGRGSSPKGLAPANASKFEPVKPGGGIFIAYATESGSVALDGNELHSPFSQALIRNLEKPISVDDLFSLVTKEVRLVTKNAQRPYKYASLENIVCLTRACTNSTVGSSSDADLLQQVKLTESDELQIAVKTNSIDAIDTYLQRYPDSEKRPELLGKISSIRRSEFSEWTMFEVGNHRFPYYVRLSSIEQFGNRVAVRWRFLVENPEAIIPGKVMPEGVYAEDVAVFDCDEPMFATAERSVVSKSGEVLFHYKWADPQYLNLSIGTKVVPGSIGQSASNLICRDELRTPLLAKSELASSKFLSLSSTVNGDGDIFYVPLKEELKAQEQISTTVIIKWHEDRSVTNLQQSGTVIDDAPKYRFDVNRVIIKCAENKISFAKIEFYNMAGDLVYVLYGDPSNERQWSDIAPSAPYAVLRRIVCNLPEVHR